MSLLAECNTGLLQEEQQTNASRQPAEQAPANRQSRPAWQKVGKRRQNGGSSSAAGTSGGNRPVKRKELKNNKGETFWRTPDQVSFIVQRKRNTCIGCYEQGHTLHECVNAPAHRTPPGYTPDWRAQHVK